MPEQIPLDLDSRRGEIDPAPLQNQIHQILGGDPADYQVSLESLVSREDISPEDIKDILLRMISGHSRHQNYDLAALIQACDNLKILTPADVEIAQTTHQKVINNLAEPSVASLNIQKRAADEKAAEAAFNNGQPVQYNLNLEPDNQS